MTIAVDFDGTIVKDDYPGIGREMPFATQTLKQLMQEGHMLVLWTVRTGRELQEAVEWCSKRGVEFYAVNRDFPEEQQGDMAEGWSRKLMADIFVDDRNVGGFPGWSAVYRMIHEGKTLDQLLGEAAPRRKHWWQR